jgi:hypothetical protein
MHAITLQSQGAKSSSCSPNATTLSPTHVALTKRWNSNFLIFLMPLGGVALIVFNLHSVPAEIFCQEFEGLGAVACAVACGGILISRVIRSLEREQIVQNQDPAANPASISSSEPNTAILQKLQSSLPADAAAARTASAASFLQSTRT